MGSGGVWRFLFLAVVLSSFLAYLPYLGMGLFDRAGNGDHALTARKLIESGTFDAWYHPPLSFAVFFVAFKLFGYGEFVARFSALVFFVFGGYFVFRLGRCLHSPAAGLLASYLYLFSPLLMRGVFDTWIDGILTSFVVASVCFMCEYVRSGRSSFLDWGGVFAGLAVLTKETALVLFPLYFFVFRRDVRLRRLLLIMSFFTGVWLVSYQLLNPEAYKYALLRPLEKLLLPYYPGGSAGPVSSFMAFVARFGAVVFVFSVVGGAWLLKRDPKRSILPVYLSLLVLLLFSLSRTGNVRYFFPAVPFLYVFAAAAFAGLLSSLSGRRHLLLLGILFGAYVFGSYGLLFFGKLGDFSREWDGNPRFALRDFVFKSTARSDILAVVDASNSDWIEFYTGRMAYSVPLSAPPDVQREAVRAVAPLYLVVRIPPQSGPLFWGDCTFAESLPGRTYNYTIYKCVWT